MSFHHDYQAWLRECEAANCPACQQQPMPKGFRTIKVFEHAELFTHPNACLKGYCCLITHKHFVELFDLDELTLHGFMREAQLAARVLRDVTGAVRINYEIHGNTAPHFHLHLFPRYLDDPFAGGPIDFRRTDPPVYRDGEFDEFVERMQQALANAPL